MSLSEIKYPNHRFSTCFFFRSVALFLMVLYNKIMDKVSFKMKFSALIWLLIAVVSILLTVSIYFNVKNLIEFWGLDTLDTITFIFTGVMDLALLIATVIGAVNSKYVISKDCVKVVNFINTKKVDIHFITEVSYYLNLKKLILRYADNKFNVVMIKYQNYQRFIDVLRQNNPQIVYVEETSAN